MSALRHSITDDAVAITFGPGQIAHVSLMEARRFAWGMLADLDDTPAFNDPANQIRAFRAQTLFQIDGRAPARLLLLLVERAGKVVTREQAADAIGTRSAGHKVLDVQVCRLRKALSLRGFTIQTVYAVGWTIDTTQAAKVQALLEPGAVAA